MRNILPFILLFMISGGCNSSRNTFTNFNGSYYKVFPNTLDQNSDPNTGIIRGSMHDAISNEILIMASVKAVSDTTFETKTDFDGNFKLILPEGSYSIIFSYTGFYSCITHDVKVYKYFAQHVDAFLSHPNLESED